MTAEEQARFCTLIDYVADARRALVLLQRRDDLQAVVVLLNRRVQALEDLSAQLQLLITEITAALNVLEAPQ